MRCDSMRWRPARFTSRALATRAIFSIASVTAWATSSVRSDCSDTATTAARDVGTAVNSSSKANCFCTSSSWRTTSAGHWPDCEPRASSAEPCCTSLRAWAITSTAAAGITVRCCWQYALAMRCDSARKRPAWLMAPDSATCACAPLAQVGSRMPAATHCTATRRWQGSACAIDVAFVMSFP